MKSITRRPYTFDTKTRDYYRVHDTSALTDARSIVFRATVENWSREYAYFDLDEDRKSKEYNRLAVNRRMSGIVRLGRYHYYNIDQPDWSWTR